MKKIMTRFAAPAAIALLVSIVMISCNEEKKEVKIENKETVVTPPDSTNPGDSMTRGNTRPVVPTGSAPTPAN